MTTQKNISKLQANSYFIMRLLYGNSIDNPETETKRVSDKVILSDYGHQVVSIADRIKGLAALTEAV